MIPNVSRGGQMGGLMVYLAGEGRGNEHADQHLVAGDSDMMLMHGYGQLDKASGLRIAADLDEFRLRRGTRVTRTITKTDKTTGEVSQRQVAGHVWHCSLSLAADEGQLTDEKWRQIAQAFVDRMGFTTEGSGKPECRWVAVRHGLSKNGNDHIHIAVNLVREDGTKASTWNDFARSQKVSGELEKEFGLNVLESREAGIGERGEKRAERELIGKRGTEETSRRTLERVVRAQAAVSVDEAEFVRRVRGAGLLIRPRYATGRDDVVTGMTVALRPTVDGEKPVWYGGGQLAKDLTLPRLREGWLDSVEGATAAIAEWRSTAKNPWGKQVAAPGREAHETTAEQWAQYTAEVTAAGNRLRDLPHEDRAGWVQAARETAGLFAAWSQGVEGKTPGPIAAAARELSKSAHVHAAASKPKQITSPSMAGVGLLLMQATNGGQSGMAELLLSRQLTRLAHAVFEMHDAVGQATRARQIDEAMTAHMDAIDARLLRVGTDARKAVAVQPETLNPDYAEGLRLARAGRPTGPFVPTLPKEGVTASKAKPVTPQRGRETGPER